MPRFSALVIAFACASGCVPDKPPPGSRPSEAKPKFDPRSPMIPQRPPLPPISAPTTTAPVDPAASNPALDPVLTAPFSDDFSRSEVGANWTSTGGTWRIEGGKLCVEHARNHPIWLRRKIPTNARVEFDATSSSEQGDLKAELWGDGRSAADAISYTDATSYLTIFGGWKNTYHVLARINEHAPDRPEIRIDDDSNDPRQKRVVAGRVYRFKVVRDDGRTVRWYVDGVEILSFADPLPLLGPGHDHFGFNDWDVKACFDNLTVTPLTGAPAPR